MAENFCSRTKNGVFFSAASYKKDTIFGAARKIFGPSYFVTALEHFENSSLSTPTVPPEISCENAQAKVFYWIIFLKLK